MTKHRIHDQTIEDLARGISPRNRKKYEREHFGHPVMLAGYAGDYAGMTGKPYRNPYPKGLRHDAFKAGYDNADPMGLYHGRNY